PLPPPPPPTLSPYTTLFRSYYRSLAGLTGTPCRHVVIIAGNHDSPAFLNAPRALLRALDVHVVGGGTREDVSNALGEQVIVLREDRKSTRLNSSHVKISYAV